MIVDPDELFSVEANAVFVASKSAARRSSGKSCLGGPSICFECGLHVTTYVNRKMFSAEASADLQNDVSPFFGRPIFRGALLSDSAAVASRWPRSLQACVNTAKASVEQK